MDTQLRHFFIAINKDGENYSAIASDDSIDRDGEFMGPDLIRAWAADTNSLTMLANHDNSMQSFIGGWTDRKVLEQDGHVALSMKPNFFSADANPLAQRIKQQIDEAAKLGIGVGVSVGFIPKEGTMTPAGYMHTGAELVESSIVPVQSNRHAYVAVAKRFRLGNETIKNKDHIIGAGVHMADEKPEAIKDVETAEVKAIKEMSDLLGKHETRITATEQALESFKLAQAEATKADAEEKKKHEEQEQKIAKDLEAYGAKLKEVKDAAEKSKSLIPSDMRGASGVSKDPKTEAKPFNATEAYMKQKGLQ